MFVVEVESKDGGCVRIGVGGEVGVCVCVCWKEEMHIFDDCDMVTELLQHLCATACVVYKDVLGEDVGGVGWEHKPTIQCSGGGLKHIHSPLCPSCDSEGPLLLHIVIVVGVEEEGLARCREGAEDGGHVCEAVFSCCEVGGVLGEGKATFGQVFHMGSGPHIAQIISCQVSRKRELGKKVGKGNRGEHTTIEVCGQKSTCWVDVACFGCLVEGSCFAQGGRFCMCCVG